MLNPPECVPAIPRLESLPELRLYVPYWAGVGNASQWPGVPGGIPTGSTPKVSSVAISLAGGFGHAMAKVRPSVAAHCLRRITFGLAGHYSEMSISLKFPGLNTSTSAGAFRKPQLRWV